MPRNTLGDMHNLLMEQMERLAQADAEEVAQEVERAGSMAKLATAINNNASTMLKAIQTANEDGTTIPKVLSPGAGQ